MFQAFFGTELTADDKADRVQELRGWEAAPAISDTRVMRFLEAENWNVPAAAERVATHEAWLQAFPAKPPSADVEAVLQTQRFRYLGLSTAKLPVIVMDFMWGGFLNVAGGEEACLDALVWFLFRTSEQVKKELGADAEPQFVTIAIGGPPPLSFSKKMVSLLAENFPENAAKNILYPIPLLVRAVVWPMIAWLPEKTKNKFVLCGEPEDLAEAVGAPLDFFPEEVLRPQQVDKSKEDALMAQAEQEAAAETAAKGLDFD